MEVTPRGVAGSILICSGFCLVLIICYELLVRTFSITGFCCKTLLYHVNEMLFHDLSHKVLITKSAEFEQSFVASVHLFNPFLQA